MNISKEKIIFLDINGVLTTNRNVPRYLPPNTTNKNSLHYDKFGPLFDQDCVEYLSELLEQTAAKIVISSTWRQIGLRNMQIMWEKRAMPGKIIDITPRANQLKTIAFKSYGMITRGHEIQDWLYRYPVEKYVIIDDGSDFLRSQKRNFVKTYIDAGFTHDSLAKAVKILNA